MTATALRRLRARATAHSLFHPSTLQHAINTLGFIQADPIRSPARAQDLILRHRVDGYRAGDLERYYPVLHVDEDYLYAYGFVSSRVRALVHPRPYGHLSDFDTEVLALARRAGPIHPRDLLKKGFRAATVTNAWGGVSRATTQSLERLHYAGLLRVVRREGGVRVYEVSERRVDYDNSECRSEELAIAIANVLAPISLKTLHRILAGTRRWFVGGIDHRAVLRRLLQTGQLETDDTDGVKYAWPAYASPPAMGLSDRVVLLAPFDPIVFDRERFEHLWGWAYRFEGYTPPTQRVRGYYAMPMLWRNRVIGWANVQRVDGVLEVDAGFVDRKPDEGEFHRAFDDEVARLDAFLGNDDPERDIAKLALWRGRRGEAGGRFGGTESGATVTDLGE